jgi:hypothetical protein
VSRVSQTPLYDQLRDERINADVVAASDTEVSAPQAQQEPPRPPGLPLVAAEGPAAGAVRGVSSGFSVEPACFGRHHRRNSQHQRGS